MAAKKLSFGRKNRGDSGRRLTLESLEERVVLSSTPAPVVEPPAAYAASVAPAATLLEDYVHSLSYQQFPTLSPSDIPLLLPEQIASIPSRTAILALSPQQSGALTQVQVQSLNVGVLGVDYLTAQQRSWLTTAQLQSLSTTSNTLQFLTDAQIAQFSPSQVQSFEYWNFPRLSTAQIPWLSPAQLQSLPSSAAFGLMSAAQRGALTQSQVESLSPTTVGLELLPATQRNWLTTAQLQTLSPTTNTLKHLSDAQVAQFSTAQVRAFEYWNFSRLSVAQIPLLSAAQLQSIPDRVAFHLMSDAQRAALTIDQIRALDMSRMGLYQLTATQRNWLTTGQLQSLAATSNTLQYLSNAQIAQFSTAQVQSFDYWNFSRLSVAQIPRLTTVQLQSIPDRLAFELMSSAQRAALTIGQVRALDMARMGLYQLTATQRSWLTTAQLRSLPSTSNTLQYLTDVQIAQFSPTQVQSFEYWNFPRLSTVQIPWLSAAQLQSLPSSSAFALMSAAQRDALTQTQVESLSPTTVGLQLLSTTQRNWLTTAQLQTLSPTTNTLRLLSDAQVAQFSAAQVRLFQYWDFFRLSVAQIPQLTAAQLQSLPSSVAFGLMSNAQRSALTQSQVESLMPTVVGLELLPTTQRNWLTAAQLQTLAPTSNTLKHLSDAQVAAFSTAQVQAFDYWNFPRLSLAQTPLLTAAQLRSIPNRMVFDLMSSAQRAALTIGQVRAFDMARVGLYQLTAQQRGWLTAAQLQSLPTTTNTLQDLTDAQIAQFSTAQVQSFEYWNFPRLSVTQIPLLTATQLQSLPTSADFGLLTDAQRGALTVGQVHSLNMADIGLYQLTATQRGWLTTAQLRTLPSTTNTLQYLTDAQVERFSPGQVQSFEYWNFPRLSVAQIPLLTTMQLRSIPDRQAFELLSAEHRAALSQWQIWTIAPQQLGLDLFTPQQRGWLTAAQLQQLTPTTNTLQYLTNDQIASFSANQIQAFDYWNFHRLSTAQIPTLTNAQIASIPSTQTLAELTTAQRDALSVAQVRSLDVATIGLEYLNDHQRLILTTAQLQSLRSIDFVHLDPQQIPSLTPQQFAAVESFQHVWALSVEAQEQLSTAQVLSLPLEIYERFVGGGFDAEKLANFTPPRDHGVGPDGLTNSPHAKHAWMRVLALTPVDQATHVAVQSGAWSDPQVWSAGQTPAAGARVVIPEGVVVTLSSVQTAAVDTIRIDGTLTFNPNVDTQLTVDTIVVNTPGKLHVGTAAAPIAQNRTARIVFPTADAIDRGWDPYALSRGVISRGETRFYGAETTAFLSLAEPVAAGDTTLRLSSVPANWQVGDRLALTGSRFWQDDFGTEEVIIRAISGTTVTVDPVAYEHAPPAGYGLRTHVANLQRNVQILGDDVDAPAARRPHLMFMQNPNVEVVNAGLYGLGRTDKMELLNAAVVVDGVLQPGTGTNVAARYPIHFHHTGVQPDSTPGIVRGVVVDGAPGWAYVNHQANVIMEDNVALNATGAAFTGEDGNEIGAFRRNLAIATRGTASDPREREELGDFGFGGHGFWAQGPAIEMQNNISAGSDDAGFFVFAASSKVAFVAEDLGPDGWAGEARLVPVGAVPMATFANNTSYSGRRGLELWFLTRGLPDSAPSTIDNFTTWGNHSSAVFIEYSRGIEINGGLLLGSGQPDAAGIGLNQRVENLTVRDVTIHDFREGIYAAQNGSTLVENVRFRTLTALVIQPLLKPNRIVAVSGNTTFATPTGTWATGQPTLYVDLRGDTNYLYHTDDLLVSPDLIVLNTPATGYVRLFFPEQDPYYVPFPSATTSGQVRTEWLDLTNMQLWENFGVAWGGQITPGNATNLPWTNGRAIPLN